MEVLDEFCLGLRQDAVNDRHRDPALWERKHLEFGPTRSERLGMSVPRRRVHLHTSKGMRTPCCPTPCNAVALAFRSMLRSQVKRVWPGSPTSGCRTMQLSRDSALQWRREQAIRVHPRVKKMRVRRPQSKNNREAALGVPPLPSLVQTPMAAAVALPPQGHDTP